MDQTSYLLLGALETDGFEEFEIVGDVDGQLLRFGC